MTVKELIERLKELPQDTFVTVRGYEGGVDIVENVSTAEKLILNVHNAWYYGKHEYFNNGDDAEGKNIVEAVHIG